jgi:hypothetical protein
MRLAEAPIAGYRIAAVSDQLPGGETGSDKKEVPLVRGTETSPGAESVRGRCSSRVAPVSEGKKNQTRCVRIYSSRPLTRRATVWFSLTSWLKNVKGSP